MPMSDWDFIEKVRSGLGSQTMNLLAGGDADDIYIFENRDTGQRVRVYASSLQEAGEKLEDGSYEDDD